MAQGGGGPYVFSRGQNKEKRRTDLSSNHPILCAGQGNRGARQAWDRVIAWIWVKAKELVSQEVCEVFLCSLRVKDGGLKALCMRTVFFAQVSLSENSMGSTFSAIDMPYRDRWERYALEGVQLMFESLEQHS